jgi:hypothetical protein
MVIDEEGQPAPNDGPRQEAEKGVEDYEGQGSVAPRLDLRREAHPLVGVPAHLGRAHDTAGEDAARPLRSLTKQTQGTAALSSIFG